MLLYRPTYIAYFVLGGKSWYMASGKMDKIQGIDEETGHISICPRCDKSVLFEAKDVGKTVRCPGCADLFTLTAISQFAWLEAEHPDRISCIAGWVTSVVLHSLLLLSFMGITWYSGFGTGTHGRNIAMVSETDSYFESGGIGLSPIQATTGELTAPPLSTEQDRHPIESLGSSAPLSGADISIDIGTLDGGVAELVEGVWGDFAGSEGAAAGGGASFFGLAARGGKFVYVVDRSGSMSGEKLQAAKSELFRSARSLKRTMKFYIIFYNNGFEPMPAEELVKASGPNKSRYLGWAEGINSRGGTDPQKAMIMALKLKPDAIWLLSDGQFNDRVCDVIRRENSGARVQIHTIAFYSQTGEDVLQRIARENLGMYKFVAGSPVMGRQRHLRQRRRP
jgi:hypothetical protein